MTRPPPSGLPSRYHQVGRLGFQRMNLGECKRSVQRLFFFLLIIIDMLGFDIGGGLACLISIHNFWFITEVVVHCLWSVLIFVTLWTCCIDSR